MTTQIWKTSQIEDSNNYDVYLYNDTTTTNSNVTINVISAGLIYNLKTRTLLKLDVSSSNLSTDQVISAILYLNPNTSEGTGQNTTCYELGNTWNTSDSASILWDYTENTRVQNTPIAQNLTPSTTNINITNIVKEWLSNSSNNNGLCFIDYESEQGSSNKRTIWSSLNKSEASLRPYIEITYGTLPNQPTGFNAISINSKTIACSWTDNSNDETGFKVFNQLGVSPNPSTDTLMGTITGTSLDLSDLIEGTFYKLYVVAYNDLGNSTVSNVVTVSPTPNLSNTFEIKYDINQEVSNQLEIKYNINQEVNNTLEIVYNLNKESVSSTLEFKYDIYGSERFTLGKYKLGEKPLAYRVNTDFFDLVETITLTAETRASVYNMIEGIVVYRKSTKNTNEYFSAIYAIGQKHLTETLTINTFSQYNLSESILISAENVKNLSENISVYYDNKSDLVEDVNVYRFGTFDKIETLTLMGSQTKSLNENIDVVYSDKLDLSENINVYYLSLRNLDETFTIRGQKSNHLNENINVVFDGKKDLVETIAIISNHFSLFETISIKSLSLQGILLYEDAQHNILIPNDTQSFLYSFPDMIEEESIIPFYIVNGKERSLSNLYVEISLDEPYEEYGENMVYLSTNGVDWTNDVILLEPLLPLSGSIFYVRISPKLGIDNKNHKINFRIFKK